MWGGNETWLLVACSGAPFPSSTHLRGWALSWLHSSRRLLVRKSEGDVRDAAYRLIFYLAIGLPLFLTLVFAYALAENLRIMSRWLERPYLFVLPAIGIVATIVLAASVRQRHDRPPYQTLVSGPHTNRSQQPTSV
jgi:cytochrome bd ubiquinol oxidase subunit II